MKGYTTPTHGYLDPELDEEELGELHDHLREQLQKVTTPDNVGIIVRTAGVGRDAEGNFLGVADANHDLTYGQDVVALQRATDTRRVKPCGVGSKPACE